MRSKGCRISFGAIFLVLLWAGSAQAGPKNVIIMIGDGMGPEQVQSARLLHPDYDPDCPRCGVLVMDEMDPDPAFAITLNVNGEITDSAASATALATGVKTVNGNVSMLPDEVTEIPTSMEAARDKGMATGILSSVYLCDATPGVWLAHAARRSCSIIIPQQIVSDVNVFLGPGETIAYKTRGKSQKGVDYVAEMAAYGDYEVVDNAAELAAAEAPKDKLLGIWGGYTLMYDIDRQNDPGIDVPTLAEMTAKAIEVLSRDEDGFFLMVEGGGIDWMAHNRDIAGTARDTLAFDDAVREAYYGFAQGRDDTLLVVTADHETGGLEVGDDPNVDFIKGITASTDFMYGLVLRGEKSAAEVLETYAGVAWDDLTPDEKQGIVDYGEMGISDVLTTRANVTWGWSGRDEGDHTATHVPVYAFGPGSEEIADGTIDNTEIGQLLLDTVDGN